MDECRKSLGLSRMAIDAGCLWPLASQDGGGRKWRFLNYEQTNQGSPVKKRKYGRIWCDVGDDLCEQAWRTLQRLTPLSKDQTALLLEICLPSQLASQKVEAAAVQSPVHCLLTGPMQTLEDATHFCSVGSRHGFETSSLAWADDGFLQPRHPSSFTPFRHDVNPWVGGREKLDQHRHRNAQSAAKNGFGLTASTPEEPITRSLAMSFDEKEGQFRREDGRGLAKC
ncbi:hypothetical protein BKA60DRAFT_539564 [Fusarium oxysporum]|nr:hypothetical protein BKA60DRAFT_539564 [Fusarium oxysporum]